MQRNEIMQRIIDLETEMFMSVNAEEAVPANTIPAFKEMRRMTYSVLSDKTEYVAVRFGNSEKSRT